MDKAIYLSDYAAIIGIDWADKKHDICILNRQKDSLKYDQIKHCPKVIDAWIASLRDKFDNKPIISGGSAAACLPTITHIRPTPFCQNGPHVAIVSIIVIQYPAAIFKRRKLHRFAQHKVNNRFPIGAEPGNAAVWIHVEP